MAGYGSDQLFDQWLTENGHTLPVAAPSPAILRQRASQYIDGLYGSHFSGVPTAGLAQERAWPRIGAVAYRQPIPDDVIPVAVIQASYAAALYESQNPGALAVAATSAGAVKRERIEGAVDTEYFPGSGDAAKDATVVLSSVEGLLAPFLQEPIVGATLGIWAVG